MPSNAACPWQNLCKLKDPEDEENVDCNSGVFYDDSPRETARAMESLTCHIEPQSAVHGHIETPNYLDRC